MLSRRLWPAAALGLALCAGFFGMRHAGLSRARDKPSFPAETITAFSMQVEQALADRKASVAVVARVGRNRRDLPAGTQFTHLAYWVYQDIRLEDGRIVQGYIAHNLYQKDDQPDRSHLVNDRPAEFFALAKELEAGIIIPTPEFQAKLLKAIDSPAFRDFHNPHYSVLASPYNTAYQNCTEHTLDVLVSALHNTTDMQQIKDIEARDFRAQTIHLGPLESLFGPVFVPDVATSDHDGEIRTATFETFSGFMQENGLASEIRTITYGNR
ncbi:MAG: DUF2145 domain-containing protein [Pseudomonadota bacterium]|nr:DUF2145 domain-containing protein [Pseudomonadota bacterium]